MPSRESTIVVTGLQCLVNEFPKELRHARCGLLMNQASVDHRWRYASECLAEVLAPSRLAALFSPQHGLWSVQQANMLETEHDVDPQLKIPIYSLYSETRRPTVEMLMDLDVLLIDLQDVGTRIYTYLWTLVHCLQACAESDVAVWVLDRPNPLGGCVVEGPLLRMEYASFVGMVPIPMRHAMTMGELAQLSNAWLDIDCELTVVPMQGWQRDMYFTETGLPWVAPSPNMPRFESTVVYPGQVLLEGTNLSEGRGTTLPFEMMGAPFIDAHKLRCAWDVAHEFGIVAREVRFAPTFDKWKGQTCHGLAWHWNDVARVRSYAATVSLLAQIYAMWPDEFAWLPPPYEYEFEKQPIDILSGDDRLRRRLEAPLSQQSNGWRELIEMDHGHWWESIDRFLLYRDSRIHR